MNFDTTLRAVAGALSPEVRDRELPEIIAALEVEHPGKMLVPIDNKTCAALLGMTPSALAELRRNGGGPPGYGYIGGLKGKYYPSRLHVLNWVAAEVEKAKIAPRKVRLTANPELGGGIVRAVA